jgi:hypothetical protein
VAVFDYKAAQGKAVPVSDFIGTTTGSVFSTSGVDFKEKASSFTFLNVRLNLIFVPANPPTATTAGEVRIFSPFLSALGKEPRETAQFLESISRFTKEPVPILTTASENRGERLPSPSYDFNRTFYVVEHPLTIEWLARDNATGTIRSSVQCIRIASYSPFPVSLNDKFCVR